MKVEEFRNFRQHFNAVDFCFVNDGSSDNTGKMLAAFCAEAGEGFRVLDLPVNSGKAEAVRQGVLHIQQEGYAFIGYWDADLATPLSEIPRMLQIIEEARELKLYTLASRMKRLGAEVERSSTRHYLGRVFSTVASIILKLPVYDSQCGAKIFRPVIIPYVFDKPFISRWLFDVEILARLRNYLGIENTLRSTLEIPVGAWKEVGGSKIKLSYMIKVPFELLKIRSHYKRGGKA